MSSARLIELVQFTRAEGGSFVPTVVAALEGARERGWRTEVVVPEVTREWDWIADLEGSGATVHFRDVGNRRAGAAWLGELLDRTPMPTVLHCHFTDWDIPAVLAARNRPCHVFWHEHSTLSRRPPTWMRNAVKFGIAARGVDGILCPAQNIVDDVRQRFGPRDRTHFFPSSIDLDAFPPVTAEERARVRARLNLGEQDQVLLHFGWHWHLKGTDIFLETVKALRERGQTRVVGLERGGGEQAAEVAAELGIADAVKVIEPIDDIREVYAAADMLVSSSRSEGMAYSVLEGLASGLPVIATRIPGHMFIARHAEACRVVETDPEALAAAVIEQFEQPPSLARHQSEQSRAWLAAELSADAAVRRLFEHFERALG